MLKNDMYSSFAFTSQNAEKSGYKFWIRHVGRQLEAAVISF